jgi:hypothetical protein
MTAERFLLMEQTRTPARVSAEDYAAEWEDRVLPEMCQPLDFLGQKGLLVEVPEEDIQEGQVARMIASRLFAVAVLPSRYAIVIELRGPRHFTSADIELLKTVAKSMKQAV